MSGERAPDFSGIGKSGLPNLEILEGNTLAVEHAKDVVIRLDEKLCRVGERFIRRKPGRLRVPVRADDGQRAHLFIEHASDASRTGLGGKKTIRMN